MKRLLFLIIPLLSCFLIGQAHAGTPAPAWAGVHKDSNCDQARYYPLGTLCQDTDNGKVYKGTGSAIVEMAPGESPTFTGKVTTAASTTAGASLNIPHGTAPTSPTNGDCWTTTAGAYCRINGATVGPIVGGESINAASGSGLCGTTDGVATCNLPFTLSGTFNDPADDDTAMFRVPAAVTLSSIGCIVDSADSGETAVLDIQECDTNGDNCTTILSATITCANTPTAGTLADTAIAANAFLKAEVGTVTGAVTNLIIYGTGTR